MPKLVVVDDDRAVLHLIRQSLKDVDVEVLTCQSASEALETVREVTPDVVLLDIVLPGISGLAVFEQIREIDARLPIIFITAGGDSDTAIEAMKLGAFDYLTKPLDVQAVRDLVSQAIELRRKMHVRVELPRQSLSQSSDALVGRSPAMLEVYKAVGQVAAESVTVLIRGESGTGKELVARAIYQHSPRAKGPFLAVNCAAIPEALLESELFGHEKGSFTGATGRRIGKFEQSNGGTIFLDEVGDMAPMLQGKVLRLLQEQRFERVGGNETIQTDVRIVAATNRDLEDMCNSGEFRPDLYYRLNGFSIDLPPLRDRGGDILLLIEHFLSRFRHEVVKRIDGIAPEALNLLTAYSWPGNVRELQSVLRQAMLQSTGTLITPEALPEKLRYESPVGRSKGMRTEPRSDLDTFFSDRIEAGSEDLYAQALEMMERALLLRVLRETDGNQSQAARILGITRGSLRNKIRALGISIDRELLVRAEEIAPAAG